MPTSATGIWNNDRGFTLIELAMVVLLIGLFSTLVMPMIGGRGADDLDSSARRLAGTVKYLYNESVLSGREYRLVFDLKAGAHRAKRQEGNGELVEIEEGPGGPRRLPGDVRFMDVTVPGRGKFTSGEVTSRIHPAGWMEETIVHLQAGKGKKGREEVLTLRIIPFTGSTEIHEGYREF